MGIKGLSQLIADLAPFAVKEGEIKNFFGKFSTEKQNYFFKLIFQLM